MRQGVWCQVEILGSLLKEERRAGSFGAGFCSYHVTIIIPPEGRYAVLMKSLRVPSAWKGLSLPLPRLLAWLVLPSHSSQTLMKCPLLQPPTLTTPPTGQGSFCGVSGTTHLAFPPTFSTVPIPCAAPQVTHLSVPFRQQPPEGEDCISSQDPPPILNTEQIFFLGGGNVPAACGGWGGQGSNPCYSSDLSCCRDLTGSLT